MRPRSFVSPRHKSRGDPRSRTGLQSGQAIVREGAQRPVIEAYIHIGIVRTTDFEEILIICQGRVMVVRRIRYRLHSLGEGDLSFELEHLRQLYVDVAATKAGVCCIRCARTSTGEVLVLLW